MIQEGRHPGVLQTRDERRAPMDVLSRGGFRSGQAGVGRRPGQSRRARSEAVGRPRLPDHRPGDRRADAGAHRHRQGRPRARPRAHRGGDLRLRQPQEPRRPAQGRGRPAARRHQRRAPRGQDAAGLGRGASWPTSARRTSPRSASRTSATRPASSPTPSSTATASSPRSAAEDDATRALIGEIVDTLGTVPDRSGKPGIDSRDHRRLLRRGARLRRLVRRGEESPANVFPLGPERTAAAAAAVAAVKTKVDDYFARCRLAAFDPRALPAAQPQRGRVPGHRRRRPDDLGRRGGRLSAGAGRGGTAAAAGRRGQPGPRGRAANAPR